MSHGLTGERHLGRPGQNDEDRLRCDQYKSTHQCVREHVLSVVIDQRVAAKFLSELVKHTDLTAEADSVLLALRCNSDARKLHLVPVLQTHLGSPEEGCDMNRTQFHSLFHFFMGFLPATLCLTPSKWIFETSVPRPELCSGPLKLVVTVPETRQSGKKRVELKIWGADNNHRWGHITKHHLGEAFHIRKSEVLYAGNVVLSTDTKKPRKPHK